ncbi:MAG: tetratricopeptide repeat protein [Haliscomenobacter sp.]|nr:tetratricopeptide repeat protein [Haliscomenobacter sp.]
MGILHALAGTVPDNYRWGARLLTGMTGTVPQGKAELEKVLRSTKEQPFLFEEETLLLYTFVLLNLSNEPEKAWKTISQAGLQPAQNPVHCYMIASVAMQSARNEEALSVLSKQPQDPALLPFPQLQFMYGTAKLRKLDLEATRHYQSFLGQYKGRNGIKEAYQRLAWCAFLKGDLPGYQRHLRHALTQGVAETGADKNALKEAQSLRPAPATLLKARLLFDGGYFQKALLLMEEQGIKEYQSLEHRLEYHYRMGRILHGLKRFPEALASYQKSMELGKNAPFYFACNAALQTGIIYETLGKPEQAKEFFRLCLSMNPDDYRTSLHQAAKAGINRI